MYLFITWDRVLRLFFMWASYVLRKEMDRFKRYFAFPVELWGIEAK